jgi:hypothetical protein
MLVVILDIQKHYYKYILPVSEQSLACSSISFDNKPIVDGSALRSLFSWTLSSSNNERLPIHSGSSATAR